LGKFFGAMALYGAMLLVTLLHIGLLVLYGGRPEWKPIATAYLGLLLLGGCFISLGLFISSLTKNQIVAGMVTFAVFLLLWIITWIGSFSGPTVDSLTQYLSITQHLDDFGKGVLDTTHLIYYLSFITFGLFITAKSVDSERWRGEPTFMANRILNILGWIGMSLVGAAGAVSFAPSLNAYGGYAKPLALTGLVLVLAYSASQWREFAGAFSKRQARYGALTGISVLALLAILIAVNYI